MFDNYYKIIYNSTRIVGITLYFFQFQVLLCMEAICCTKENSEIRTRHLLYGEFKKVILNLEVGYYMSLTQSMAELKVN